MLKVKSLLNVMGDQIQQSAKLFWAEIIGYRTSGTRLAYMALTHLDFFQAQPKP